MGQRDILLEDIEAVKKISIVPNMLDVICQTTGMGFAAIARVTNDRWLACSVRDEVAFGLEEGGELAIETTLCKEVRALRKPIVFDDVSKDIIYIDHPTPKIYGLQSYISVPIILSDNTFFGTLCAISSKPVKINNHKVLETFKMFAELLAFHLESADLLERSYEDNQVLLDKNKVLANVNTDLDNFVYTASHDLKSPLASIEGLLNALAHTIDKEQFDRENIREIIAMMQSSLSRFKLTIKDLTAIVEADHLGNKDEHNVIDIHEIIASIKQDLDSLIRESAADIQIEMQKELPARHPKKVIKSIVYNLISNAIKYRSPERHPKILVKLETSDGKTCLTVSDNGLGISADKQENIFTMFKRYHDHVEGSGLGLYLVKRMVNNLHGTIKVDSVEGAGSTFTVILKD